VDGPQATIAFLKTISDLGMRQQILGNLVFGDGVFVNRRNRIFEDVMAFEPFVTDQERLYFESHALMALVSPQIPRKKPKYPGPT
jgi:hypothetical protein